MLYEGYRFLVVAIDLKRPFRVIDILPEIPLPRLILLQACRGLLQAPVGFKMSRDRQEIQLLWKSIFENQSSRTAKRSVDVLNLFDLRLELGRNDDTVCEALLKDASRMIDAIAYQLDSPIGAAKGIDFSEVPSDSQRNLRRFRPVPQLTDEFDRGGLPACGEKRHVAAVTSRCPHNLVGAERVEYLLHDAVDSQDPFSLNRDIPNTGVSDNVTRDKTSLRHRLCELSATRESNFDGVERRSQPSDISQGTTLHRITSQGDLIVCPAEH